MQAAKCFAFYLLLQLSRARLRTSEVPLCSSVQESVEGEQPYLKVPVCADVPSLASQVAPKQFAGCPGVIFDFPRDNQVTDYVRYRSYFPALNEATICFWANTSDYTSTFTGIFSYAISGSDNEILFGFENSHNMIFHVKGHRFVYNIANRFFSRQNIDAHFCGWFSSRSRQIAFYINAIRSGFQSYGHGPVLGGGDLLLGQDQDNYNAGRLDSNQAYRGTISNVLVWPRVLSDNEIRGVTIGCNCPDDYSVAMTMDRVELHGSADYRVDGECPKL